MSEDTEDQAGYILKKNLDKTVIFHQKEKKRLDRISFFVITGCLYSLVFTVLVFNLFPQSANFGKFNAFSPGDFRTQLLILSLLSFLAFARVFYQTKGLVIAIIVSIFFLFVALVSPFVTGVEITDWIKRIQFNRLTPAEQLADDEHWDEVETYLSYKYN
jgi:hypothetical protein